MWFPNDFLTKMVPHMLNTLDKKAKLIVQSARTQYLNTKIVNLVRYLSIVSSQNVFDLLVRTCLSACYLFLLVHVFAALILSCVVLY